jgi:hypothetical protein
VPSDDHARTSWRLVAAALLIQTTFGAAFPRLAWWLRWPTRLRGRPLLAYVAFNTALGFLYRAWFMPRVRRSVARHAQIREALKKELGRDPTADELIAAFRDAAR